MHQLLIDIPSQSLYHFEKAKLSHHYRVSTAKNGVGEAIGSEKTPRGWHVIRAKIGENAPPNTVFVSRRPTGELYSANYAKQFPERDWILTRILWLSGLEVGRNRFGNCDTMKRYIYIHGSPDEKVLGIPSSHGCINMHNQDIIKLYNIIPIGTKVYIRG